MQWQSLPETRRLCAPKLSVSYGSQLMHLFICACTGSRCQRYVGCVLMCVAQALLVPRHTSSEIFEAASSASSTGPKVQDNFRLSSKGLHLVGIKPTIFSV